jgi:hypothetical protein
MFRRVFGEPDAMDSSGGNSMPRLIGNPGVIQEYLSGER